MASSAERTFILAVQAAETTRQAAKAAAFVTYAFTPANLATYQTALASADTAYITAVNTAAGTLGITLNSGYSGLIGGNIATVGLDHA